LEPVEWFYFVSPEDALRPFVDDNGTMINFGEEGPGVHSWAFTTYTKGLYDIAFRFVYEKAGIDGDLKSLLIDKNATTLTQDATEVVWIDRPIHMQTAHNPNFGHVLADEMFVSWFMAHKLFDKKEFQYMQLYRQDVRTVLLSILFYVDDLLVVWFLFVTSITVLWG